MDKSPMSRYRPFVFFEFLHFTGTTMIVLMRPEVVYLLAIVVDSAIQSFGDYQIYFCKPVLYQNSPFRTKKSKRQAGPSLQYHS